jgi:hypothetical protein
MQAPKGREVLLLIIDLGTRWGEWPASHPADLLLLLPDNILIQQPMIIIVVIVCELTHKCKSSVWRTT